MIYTIKQFATLMSLSPYTILRKIKEGKIKAININPGGTNASWRIPESEKKRIMGEI